MFMDRKGQMSFVAKMILILVSAIILFIAISAIMGQFIVKGDVEACRLSVLTQANTKIMLSPTGDKSPFNINCNKYYVNFYDTRVLAGYDPDPKKMKPMEIQYDGKKMKTIPILNDYVVNQVLAEEMRKCWYMFGEGKLDVFDNSFFSNNDVCFVCTEATIMNTQQKTFSGIIDYMKRTSVKQQGITYFEYMNNTEIGRVNWEMYTNIIHPRYFEYEAGKKYLILFLKQDRRLATLALRTGLMAFVLGPASIPVNIIISIFDGDANKMLNNYFVIIVPDDQVHRFCDVQAS